MTASLDRQVNSDPVDRVRRMRTGEQVLLRPLTTSDVPLLAQWSADAEVGVLHGAQGMLSSEQANVARFDDWAAESDTRVGLAIQRASGRGELVGALRLVVADVRGRCGSMGILLGRMHLERGYGTEAMRLAVHVAFGDLGLHRLEVTIMAANRRSIAMAQRVGFQLEGRRRQARLIAGRYEDLVIMGLLRSEWSSQT